MGESAEHIKLVYLLEKNVLKDNKNINSSLIFIDTPESRNNCPPTINGYKPDLYYQFEKFLIIGEAKTRNDLDNIHTRKQIETYILMCSNFEGNSLFYLAVPWKDSNFAYNTVKKIMKDLGASIIFKVVDEIQSL